MKYKALFSQKKGGKISQNGLFSDAIFDWHFKVYLFNTWYAKHIWYEWKS